MHNVYMAPGCNGRIFYYTSFMLVLLSITLQNDSKKKLIWICVVTVEGGVYLISTYQVSNIVQGKNLLCFSGLQYY